MDSIMPKDPQGIYSNKYVFGYEKHHVMNGSSLRTKSENYGLYVFVPPYYHRLLHGQGGVHYGIDSYSEMKRLKEIAQKTFEKKYSHELWLKEFRRNYL